MNVIKRICLLIACGVLLMSCAQSGMQDDGLYGYLTLDVTDDLKDLVQMKSSSSGQLVYRVDIYDSDEVLVKSFADHNEAMAQPIPLLMDRYKVHAINGEYKTAFNAPCFDDQENVRVYPEKPASVDLVCNLSQVKFSVHFPEDDDFKNSFSKYELIVSNGTDELIFSSAPVAENPTYGGFADTAYLKVPEDGILKYTLSMLNKDGAHYSSVAQIESVGRAEHYHLDFKVGEREDIEGALVLDILLDGHERACFQIIIPPIRHKIFNGRPRSWTQLHLIQNDQCFTYIQFGSIEVGQIHKQCIKIIQIMIKQINDFFWRTVEINQNVAFIFRFSKLFSNITLSDTSGTVNQQSCTSGFFMFPIQEFFIYLSFHSQSPS